MSSFQVTCRNSYRDFVALGKMEQGFEEWKKTHSSFRSIEDPQSNDNSFWQHNSIQLEKEVEFYRNRFNDARTCLVTNRVAVDELAKVREREKTEMELQYEVEMNGIRKDTIDKIEKYQHRHVLIDEEKRRMLAELGKFCSKISI